MNRPRDHVQSICLFTVLVTVLMGAVRVDAQSVLNFPRVLSSETVFTGVAIGNPTSGEATVTLTAYGADGTLAGGGENPTTVTIPAGGQLARQHRELFGEGEFNGWVQATSGTAGLTGFFLNANPALTDLDGALAGESGGELILPFIAGMAPSLTEVTVVNPEEETATVTLGANAAYRGDLGELLGIEEGSAIRTGWIEVEAPVGYVASYIGYGNTVTPSFALVAGAPEEDASGLQVYSQVAEGAGFFTGVALVNPGDETATVEFYTVRPDGTTVGKTELTLEPGARLGRLYRELLASSLQQVGGWTLVRSSAPLVGVALFGGTNGFALASVPGQAISADYEPPAQVASAITGTVRQAGAGVGNVTVRLSGPVGQTRTTDPEGRYIFGELPPGEYVVTASRLGAELAPAEREVTLGFENVREQDFEAGGVAPSEAPLVTFVTPTSTFEGNRLLNIKVLGGNFNPASVVVFNGEELQTVFVNSAELQAVIPTRLLTEETDAEIRVVTPPPGGGTSTAAVFVVNPKPSDPLLAGRINVGSFPAGVAVDSRRGIALVTNESGDSVSVVDISREIVTDTIGVGRSSAEGIAVDSERGIGLVVNGEDGNVSVVDLDSLTVTGTIGVGDRPAGVAIDLERGEAVVANRGNNTVSVIDLDTLAVTGTIGVGGFPRGVAIDSGEGLAFVTNANSNTVSVIDLERGVVVETIEVGSAPTGVAVYLKTGHVVVTNSGVTSGTGLGALSTVSIIDVVDEEVVADVPVGSAPFGVDVDQREQLAVVANFGSNDVTLIRIPNPMPRIEEVSPATFPTDGSTFTFTITITGTGFLPTSVVTLNGQTLPTTYVSATELKAEVSGELLEELLQVSSTVTSIAEARLGQVSPFNFTIGVTNPGPGGGSSDGDAGITDITPEYKRPTLRSITPDEIESDADELLLTLNGSNFFGGSIVNFRGEGHSPFDSSANRLRVLIPGTDLDPGMYAVSVTNPGAGTSGSSVSR